MTQQYPFLWKIQMYFVRNLNVKYFLNSFACGTDLVVFLIFFFKNCFVFKRGLNDLGHTLEALIQHCYNKNGLSWVSCLFMDRIFPACWSKACPAGIETLQASCSQFLVPRSMVESHRVQTRNPGTSEDEDESKYQISLEIVIYYYCCCCC